MTDTKTPLDYGGEYARMFGWRVFPLFTAVNGDCTCNNPRDCKDKGKHPRWHFDLLPNGLTNATVDQSLIARWHELWPSANMGIATGAESGIVVVDIDPRHGGDESLADLEREHGKLPCTVTALTGGGGIHYFFRHPGEYVKCRNGNDAIAPGVDVKGDGGYVVGTPSMHASGIPYCWEISSQPWDVGIADMPDWLMGLLRQTSSAITPRDDTPRKKVTEGGRNSYLTSLAGTMRRRGMSENAITAALLVVNTESCVPPLDEREVGKIAHSVVRYAPDNPPVLVLPISSTTCAPWIDTYIGYARSISPMTPRLFHESSALWLASTAIARRVVLDMPFGKVYPNLYFLWLAETTLYRKTTGQAIPRAIAAKLFPYLVAPQDTTPEAMLNDMAGSEPANLVHLTPQMQEAWKDQRGYSAQRGMIMDEMSGMLASAGRDYNAGLIESYLRFYDCEEKYIRSTKGQGWQVVNNAYVSILGASTPRGMSQHISADHLWGMGWWPRFAILTPLDERPEWEDPHEAPEPPALTDALKSLIGRLPHAVWPQQVQAVSANIVDSAFDTWSMYNKALSYDLLTEELDHRLYGTYGRLPMNALKVGLILATLDWTDRAPVPVILDQHINKAMQITERWRESAHRALAMAQQSEYEGYKRRVLRILSKAGASGATIRDFAKSMKDVRPTAIEDTVKELLLAGDIELHDPPNTSHGGRPTTRYFLTVG